MKANIIAILAVVLCQRQKWRKSGVSGAEGEWGL